MSFKKFLSNVGLIEVEANLNDENNNSNKPTSSKPTPNNSVSPELRKSVSEVNNTTPNTINSEVYNYVKSVINNGVDVGSYTFSSFESIVENIKSSGLADNVAYSSAFIAMRATIPNLSKYDLVNSITSYMDKLKSNTNNVLQKCKSIEEGEMVNTKNDITAIQDKIRDTKALLSTLEQNLIDKEKELADINTNIIEIKASVNVVTNEYTNALSEKISKIESFIN